MKNKENKTAISIISPKMFYSNKNEKTKLNWFCYELSMAIYNKIKKKLGEKLIKYSVDDQSLATFSVHLSKEAK
ncbi:MAG: hypothetical protein V1870_01615 [Candidatus Aenigmatarchaeota archaeon]